MASKGRPYRSFCFEGFDVLVGRGDADNDYLTFRIAKPHDLWLHVAGGTPGSHVVVRNPNREQVPQTVVERAAGLAAWYSKARNAGRLEVHYCQASDVRKPKGAPAGLVQLAKYKKVKVSPTPPPEE